MASTPATGKEREDHSGFEFDYFGARYYDPRIGSFTTIDKASQFASGYVYGGNNPLIGVDPDGNLFFLATPFLLGAAFSGSQAVMNAAITGEWDWGKIALHTIVGGLGGTAATYGHADKWLLNMAEGSAQAVATNGLHNLIDEKGFAEGIGIAGGSGAAFGFLESEHYQNYAAKHGFRSNKDVFRQIAADEGLVAAADYWAKRHGLEFDPANAVTVNDRSEEAFGYIAYNNEHGRVMIHYNEAHLVPTSLDVDAAIVIFEKEMHHYNFPDLDNATGEFLGTDMYAVEARGFNNALDREPYTHIGRRRHFKTASEVGRYGGTPSRAMPYKWWESRRVYSGGHSLVQASYLLY